MQETQVLSLGQKEPLKKETATHSTISCPNPIDWWAWLATVHGVTKESDIGTGAPLTCESRHSSPLVLTGEGGRLTHAAVDLLCAFHLENSYNGVHCGGGGFSCHLPTRSSTQVTNSHYSSQDPAAYRQGVGGSKSIWMTSNSNLGQPTPCVLRDSPICSKQTFVMWNFKLFCLIWLNRWLNHLEEILF